VLIASTAEMHALGVRIAAHLRRGDLVIASGPLGAGKTTLTRGIGAGLHVVGDITSPTFVIAREHEGPVRLIHVDAYRLRPDGGGNMDPALALEDLDLAIDDAIVVMEWGEGLGALLSPEYLSIEIEIVDDGAREVRLAGHGARWADETWFDLGWESC
jgi:tRNA threonylcarbamoyladenosine biosynthesis protein TsaE